MPNLGPYIVQDITSTASPSTEEPKENQKEELKDKGGEFPSMDNDQKMQAAKKLKELEANN